MSEAQWGLYEGDPPPSDCWYFRSYEIALMARALALYIGTIADVEERQHALIVRDRIAG